jgi:leucyl-tRNA synthetase
MPRSSSKKESKQPEPKKGDAYDPKVVEPKWQKVWEESGIHKALDDSKKPKFYSLFEFNYPSGDGLHVGHVRTDTAMDIISRKRRMQGFNVLYPVGWDSFGLPTENYAIKTGIHPKIVTKKNTDNFRRQLKSLGLSFDWDREIDTSDPNYYRWTQWIFLEMYKHDLAYKKKMVVNWCPKDKIVLANEEVIDGKCERCGTPVEKREKEQWMLAITKYADRLDKDLDTVDYKERIKVQQRNWIGRSEGAEIEFGITNLPGSASQPGRLVIKVFTTRPDTLFGATYMVLAPEHELIQELKDEISNYNEVEKYIKSAKSKTEIERTTEKKIKSGVELKGIKAINPANQEEIPVFIADYVLANYGTGAIMAVPVHDERDFDFAKQHNLPVREVIEPLFIKKDGKDGVRPELPFKKRHAVVAVVKHWSEDKYLCLKWKKTDWRGFVIGGIEEGEEPAETGKREIAEETGYTSAKFIRPLGGIVHAQFFHAVKNENRWAHFHGLYYELTDGAKKETSEVEQDIHDVHWISGKDLEKFLDWVTDMRLIWLRAYKPEAFLGGSALHSSSRVAEDGILTNSGKFNGLKIEEAKKAITEFVKGKIVTTYKLRDWIFSRQRYWGEPIPMVFCEHCKKEGRSKDGWVPVPEKDLPVKLPEVENYLPTDSGESPLAAITDWVNTQCPVCGSPAKRETDTMPNWAGSSWYFLRYIDPHNQKNLADKKKLDYWMEVDWYNGGMEHTTLHLLYSRFWNKFLFDIGIVPVSEPYKKRTSHGIILAPDGEKMSKSRGNVINPDPIIKDHGADTLRLYEMFMGPFDQMVAWSTDGIVGPRRFLDRVWKLQEKVVPKWPFDANLESAIHSTIKKVSDDIESMSFNTAVSAMMILVNEMEKREKLAENYYKHLLHILAPFAPHIAEELWSRLGNKTSIHLESWPKANEEKIQSGEVTIIIQVNGKVRGEFQAKKDIEERDATQKAFELEEVKKWIGVKKPKKVIYVKGKLISIVV